MPFEWSSEEFHFTSERGWTHAPSDDPSRLQLLCASTATTLTLSMDAYQVPPEKFEKVALFLLESRKRAYADGVRHLEGADSNVDVSYSGEVARMHSSGAAYEVYYEGLHRGRFFLGFLGYVTARKVVNLFVQTELSFSPERKGMFREVVNGFQVKIP